MKKAAVSKKQGMNKQHLYWKVSDGKRYTIKQKEQNGKKETIYELQFSTNNLERFIDEDKDFFLSMEQELNGADFELDFDNLETELSSIDFPANR